jgi:hypothetical protein
MTPPEWPGRNGYDATPITIFPRRTDAPSSEVQKT